MNIKAGIKLLEEQEGTGLVAERGDDLIYNVRAFLNKGEEVTINRLPEANRSDILLHHPQIVYMHDGYEFINFHTRLGCRNAWAGVEYSLYGMREGGFRKIKVAPHLAFGEAGYPEIKVPAKAVITFQIWLRTVTKRVHDEKQQESNKQTHNTACPPPVI